MKPIKLALTAALIFGAAPGAMANGVWFRLNVGRERNADPKWLLPEICRQGGVTKADIGAIRVHDAETRFQVDARVAGDFAERVAARQKGGVRIFTKSAALHCAREGYKIRVNSIHPGYIVTPMVEGFVAGSGDAAAVRQKLVSLHPIGHLGEPDDIAYGVLYLASDESKFVTGSELVIDGGYTAQ